MGTVVAPLSEAIARALPYWHYTLRNVFNNSPQGVWYDPSDTTTLFQDSAGTTPVTASGQPVGLMLDKSGRGNHATQPTAASRPIYRRGDSRGVVNQLTWSEDFSNAGWGKSGVTVSAAASSAFKVDFASNSQYVQQSTTTVEGGANYAVSIEAKRNSGKCVLRLTKSDSSVFVRANLDTATQALVFKNTSGSATFTSATVTPVDAEFDRYTLVGNFTATQVFAGLMLVREASDETTITVRKAQMSKASTALPYQRNDGNLGGVATGASTDLHWLETDGVDDGMATGSIDFTGTDKVSVFAGVRKLSDAARGVFCELSVGVATNAGSFVVSAPEAGASGYYGVFANGSALGGVRTNDAFGAPISSILKASYNIGSTTLADEVAVRINGAVTATTVVNAGPLGTGNFGNHPLYLFRRGGTSLPFNGWFYGLAITGRLATNAETVATERFLAAKSAVVIP